jgi:hypothetical protein
VTDYRYTVCISVETPDGVRARVTLHLNPDSHLFADYPVIDAVRKMAVLADWTEMSQCVEETQET